MKKLILIFFMITLLLSQTISAKDTTNSIEQQSDNSLSQVDKLYNQAIQYQKAGNYEKAIDYYTKIINLNPKHTDAYLMRGNLYIEQEIYDLAISDLHKVTQLSPNNADGFGLLGWLHILSGKFEEAKELCQKAYELAPYDFAWVVNLGHTYLLTGNRLKAREYYEKALHLLLSEEEFQKGPVADLELFIKRGWQVEASKQELDWMKNEFQKRVNNLKEIESLNKKIEELYKAGKYEDAIPYFKKAIEITKKT